MKQVFKFIRASLFLPEFCDIPFTAMTRHKMRGRDGNGRPVDFTDQEKKKIAAGVKKWAATVTT